MSRIISRIVLVMRHLFALCDYRSFYLQSRRVIVFISIGKFPGSPSG